MLSWEKTVTRKIRALSERMMKGIRYLEQNEENVLEDPKITHQGWTRFRRFGWTRPVSEDSKKTHQLQ